MAQSLVKPFRPTKVIVLSELTTREKEQYYQMMVVNKAKFHKDEDGRFIGNIRLLAPFVKKSDHEEKKKDTTNYSLSFQERLTKLKQDGFINVSVVAQEPLDYKAYPRFTALIAYNGDIIRPKSRPFHWIMKVVEDIYDYRFSHEKNDVEREEDSPSFDLMMLIFPVFVVRRVGTNVGLKSMVDQSCWDLLYNTHVFRHDYLELEIFARFLQEFYDHDDLLFFLYVRSVISKVLRMSFKSRWVKPDGPGRQPKSLWMTYREASYVARTVFGSDNEDMYRDFMRLITPQMVGQRTSSGDNRRIDVTEYLHLSVVGYHQSQTRNLVNSNAGIINSATTIISGGDGISNVVGDQRTLLPLPGQQQQQQFDTEGGGGYEYREGEESNYQQQQHLQEEYEDSYYNQYNADDQYGDDNFNGNNAGDSSYYDDNYYYQEQQQQQQQNYDYENNNDNFNNNNNNNSYYGDNNNLALSSNNSQFPYYNDLGEQVSNEYSGEELFDLQSLASSPIPYMSSTLVAAASNNNNNKVVEASEGLDEGSRHYLEDSNDSNYSPNNNNYTEYEVDNEWETRQQQAAVLGQLEQRIYSNNNSSYNMLAAAAAENQAAQDDSYEGDGFQEQLGEEEEVHQYQDRLEGEEVPEVATGVHDIVNEYEAIQMQREAEFMRELMEPLLSATTSDGQKQLPEEFVQYIMNDLGDRLRQTVQIFLNDKNIADIRSFDEQLVDFLQLDELRMDMESSRDDITTYYREQFMPQEGEEDTNDAAAAHDASNVLMV